jgi:hypothetical protein
MEKGVTQPLPLSVSLPVFTLSSPEQSLCSLPDKNVSNISLSSVKSYFELALNYSFHIALCISSCNRMHSLGPAIILTRSLKLGTENTSSQNSELKGRTTEHGICDDYIAKNDRIYNGSAEV